MHPAALQRIKPTARCASPGTEFGERLVTYLKEARGAFSDNTERAVRSDVEIFTDWCEARGLRALPASA